MKKNLLLMMMCVPVILAAQNGVSVSNLAVSAGSPTTVTFEVSWKDTGMPEVWIDTVWVWVDYNNAGKMECLPLLSGATLTATSAPDVGKVREEPGNNKGVWVVGDARTKGSFSATVQLLTATANFSGACVYGSNYPPVGKYTSATGISFTGTPQYTVVLKKNADGTPETRTEDSPFTVPAGYTVQSFTDKTGAPGIINCKSPVVQQLMVSSPAYCAGSGVTFALANTENGAVYQLYKNDVPVDGATLTGGGSPATFSGSFKAGTYSVRTVPGGDFCPAEMTGKITVNESPLPDIPTIAVSAATVCRGTNVVFRASGTAGSTYTWLGAAGTASGIGNGTLTVSGAATGTKSVSAYARLTSSGTTCQSANAATVTAYVSQPGAEGQTADPVCGCVPNLTACNGYCRNLAADNAVCYSNLEVKEGCKGTDMSGCTPPAGWSTWLTSLAATRTLIALFGTDKSYWTATAGGPPLCRYAVGVDFLSCSGGGAESHYYWIVR
jgi:hypothetical protein